VITQEQLHNLFEYKDGNLFWKINSSQNVKSSDLAGGKDSKGRWRICFERKSHQAHRLIFLWCKGFLPLVIDHIDNNPLNNKIENLRPANTSKNGFNRKMSANNTSGFKGVTWNKTQKKWQTYIKANNKTYYFGYFKHKEIAGAVVLLARYKLHGEFMRIA